MLRQGEDESACDDVSFYRRYFLDLRFATYIFFKDIRHELREENNQPGEDAGKRGGEG